MNSIAKTAYLIAMYRALETERPGALFHDPFARYLSGQEGTLAAEVLGDKERNTTVIAIRTCAIDEMLLHLVNSGKIDTVLNLGAGLDTRPYRLDLPPSLRWIEVDLPEILTYKEQKLSSERASCSLERIKLDLMDIASRQLLFSQINASAKQVLVITEGILSYLTEEQVASLANDLHRQSNFYWWLLELASPLIPQNTQRNFKQKLFDQYFANGGTTLLFAPKQGKNFFQAHGWVVHEFRPFWQEAERLKRQSSLALLGACLLRLFAKQSWLAISQHTGFILLKQMPQPEGQEREISSLE